MRQHLDAGGVLLEVTRLANGSVVVEFGLLIVADLEAQAVSAAFLAAFQNASLLEVVAGDTFIWGTCWSGRRGTPLGWTAGQPAPSYCLCFRKTSLHVLPLQGPGH